MWPLWTIKHSATSPFATPWWDRKTGSAQTPLRLARLGAHRITSSVFLISRFMYLFILFRFVLECYASRPCPHTHTHNLQTLPYLLLICLPNKTNAFWYTRVGSPFALRFDYDIICPASAHYRFCRFICIDFWGTRCAFQLMGGCVSFVLATACRDVDDDDHHLVVCVRHRREVAVVVSRRGNLPAVWQLAFPLPLIINFSAAFSLASRHCGLCPTLLSFAAYEMVPFPPQTHVFWHNCFCSRGTSGPLPCALP